VGEQVKKHNVILPASDPGSVSNNALLTTTRSFQLLQKRKKMKRRLRSAHEAQALLPWRHSYRGREPGRSSGWCRRGRSTGRRRPPVRGIATNGAHNEGRQSGKEEPSDACETHDDRRRPGWEEARASRGAAASKADANVARGGGCGGHTEGMGLNCKKYKSYP